MLKNVLIESPFQWVYDGASNTLFHPIGELVKSSALIKTGEIAEEAKNIHNFPMLVNCRPLHAKFGSFKRGDLAVSQTKAIVQGKSCVVLERVDLKPGMSRTYTVDPGRDFIVLRASYAYQGVVNTIVNISYREKPEKVDRQNIWIPQNWDITFLSSTDKVSESYSANLLEYAVNPSFSADEFVIHFPVGTRVRDIRQKPTLDYIVRAEGKKRDVLAQEFGATYEQLVNSEPGQALKSNETQHSRLLWLGLAFVAIAVLIAITLRCKRATPPIS